MNHLVIGMRQLVIILSLPCECTHLVHGEEAVDSSWVTLGRILQF